MMQVSRGAQPGERAVHCRPERVPTRLQPLARGLQRGDVAPRLLRRRLQLKQLAVRRLARPPLVRQLALQLLHLRAGQGGAGRGCVSRGQCGRGIAACHRVAQKAVAAAARGPALLPRPPHLLLKAVLVRL